MTIEDEAEAIYNSIVDRNKKKETYVRYSNIIGYLFFIFFFGGMILLSVAEKQLPTQIRTSILISWFLIVIFLFYLAGKFNPKKIIIFNSDTEKLFFHLYDA